MSSVAHPRPIVDRDHRQFKGSSCVLITDNRRQRRAILQSTGNFPPRSTTTQRLDCVDDGDRRPPMAPHAWLMDWDFGPPKPRAPGVTCQRRVFRPLQRFGRATAPGRVRTRFLLDTASRRRTTGRPLLRSVRRARNASLHRHRRSLGERKPLSSPAPVDRRWGPAAISRRFSKRPATQARRAIFVYVARAPAGQAVGVPGQHVHPRADLSDPGRQLSARKVKVGDFRIGRHPLRRSRTLIVTTAGWWLASSNASDRDRWQADSPFRLCASPKPRADSFPQVPSWARIQSSCTASSLPLQTAATRSSPGRCGTGFKTLGPFRPADLAGKSRGKRSRGRNRCNSTFTPPAVSFRERSSTRRTAATRPADCSPPPRAVPFISIAASSDEILSATDKPRR